MKIAYTEKQPPEVLFEKGVLKDFSKFTGKHLFSNFIKKGTLVQMFPREFWEIFKSTFFEQHLRKTAYVHTMAYLQM